VQGNTPYMQHIPTQSDNPVDDNLSQHTGSFKRNYSPGRSKGTLTLEQKTKLKIQTLIRKKKNTLVMKNPALVRNVSGLDRVDSVAETTHSIAAENASNYSNQI
jgi:hypothetical protein